MAFIPDGNQNFELYRTECKHTYLQDFYQIWNSSKTWIEFTECFQNTTLIFMPSMWLWSTVPIYLTYLIKARSQPLQGSWKGTVAQMLTVLQLGISAMKTTNLFPDLDPTQWHVQQYSTVLESATLILVLLYSHLEKMKGFVTSGVLAIYWTLMCAMYTIICYSKMYSLEPDVDSLEHVLFCVCFGQLLLTCFAENAQDSEKNPYKRASFLSRLTFSWLDRVIKLGYSRPLKDDDLLILGTSEQTKNVIPAFEARWESERGKSDIKSARDNKKNAHVRKRTISRNEEKLPSIDEISENDKERSDKESTPKKEKTQDDADDKPGVSLVKVLLMTFGFDFLIGLVWMLGNTCLHFFNPVLLKLLIDFTEDATLPIWKGYVLALGLMVQKFVTVFTNRQLHGIYYINFTMRIRSALTTAIYKKSLSMNNSARVESTVGEMVNLMSVDAEHIRHIYTQGWGFVACPLSIIISLVFLYYEVGWAMLGGLAVLVVITPINVILVRKCRAASKLGMDEKDKRMKLMNEILNGIKVLKLYAWEMAFGKKILDIRENESKYTTKDRTAGMLMHFSWTLAPFAIGVATFSTYIFVSENHRLDAQTAFVAISLFDILRGNLNYLPWLITDLIKGIVSVKRLNKFLNHDDLDLGNVTSNPSEEAIQIKDGMFQWDDKIGPCLKDINVTVPKGSLVAVVGRVGYGKSSLVSAILGEMDKLSGDVNVDGSSAFVPQQAWIQNASLRNNILFGKNMDKPRYEKVIDACALKTDLDMFATGDKTIIGEKGVNLSGGQKQRVSLARAVYFDADIYLLDDPLSAVDSHVGKHIFQKVIGKKGLLKDKTRVLVTHGIRWLPYVDRIIAMDQGVVAEIGSYEELMNHDGAFAKFMKTYLNEQHSDDSDSDNEVIELKSKTLLRLDSFKTDANDMKGSTIQGDKGDGFKRSVSCIDNSSLQRRKLLTKSMSKSDLDRKLARSVSMYEHRQIDKLKRTNSVDTRLDSEIFKRSSSVCPEDNDFDDNIQDDKIDEEDVEIGSVESTVIFSYLKAVGLKALFIILALFGLEQISTAAGCFWLTTWTADSDLHNLTKLSADSEERYQRNVFYLSVYGGLGIVQAVSVLLYCRTKLLCSLKAGSKIHKDLLMNVIRAPMSFFDTTPIGQIVSRFSKDVNSVDFSLPDGLQNIADAILTGTATVLVITFSTPGIATMIIPVGIVFFSLQRFFTPTHRQLRRIESKARSPIFSHFSETLSGVSVIRAFKLQRRFEEEAEKKLDHYLQTIYLTNTINHWLGVRMSLMAGLITGLTAVFGVMGRDSISAAMVGLSISYSMQVTRLFEWLMHLISNFESDMISMERISQYTAKPIEAPLKTAKEPPSDWPEAGNVELNAYSVRYREGQDCVLKGIDLSIRAGEKIGIVGRTGAGKSSLTYSVFRLLEPASGTITIDGEDVTKLGLHDLRSRLTILPQEPVLFAGSLRMNLDPLDSHTDEQLWRALEHAHLQAFIEALPEKLNFECGEGGQNLSVGQRQLVCLARSLLKKTKILVLDEATAGVDMATDELIQNTISTEFKECTVMTIAHRLNTVIDYDRILVLDKGQVKEFDSPDVLLKDKKSIFYGMAKDAGLV